MRNVIVDGQNQPPENPSTTPEANTLTPGAKQSLGKAHPHESAKLHVSGAASYVDDYAEPADMCHLAVITASIARGHIETLDLTDVAASEGVLAVFGVDDIPGLVDAAPVFGGDPLLTKDEIKYFAQPIALVAARSFRVAQQAALKANVSYVETALELDALNAAQAQSFVRPSHQMAKRLTDKANDDIRSVIAGSPYQLSSKLNVGGQEHFYLEGQVSVALPTDEGGIHLVTSSQHPSETQKLIAEVLEIPFRKVTVEMRRMGGGFGGKESQAAPWSCLAALAAYHLGCAAKLRLPRQQDMVVTGKRHPFVNQCHIGFDDAGKIHAADIQLIGDCGHSADLSDAIVDRAMFHADNAYHLENCDIVGHRAKTDTVSHTAFRGFGGPQGMMMIEGVMDDIARTLGVDPLDVRKTNLYKNGDTTPYHQTIEDCSLLDIVERLEASSEYRQRKQSIVAWNKYQPVLKRGIALTPLKFGISFTLQHLNQAGALINVYTDGSVLVNHGGTEMGQGLHTKIGQVVADALGVGLSQIGVNATRTDKVPNTSPTAASSGTDLNGKAAENAALIIKQRLTEFLAQSYSVSEEAIQFEAGQVFIGQSEHVLSFADVVEQAYVGRVPLSATGYYKTPKIYYDRSKAEGRPFFYFAQGAAVSEVIIDTLTGEYSVEAVDILHDVGKSLNPAIDIGQIEGGFIQGMGWLTTEELVWNTQGKLMTNGPATYKIPAMGDTPKRFNVSLFDRPNQEATVYNSKAVGEPPFMLAISVWSALRDAISSVVDYTASPELDTPATPERVLSAVEQLQAKE